MNHEIMNPNWNRDSQSLTSVFLPLYNNGFWLIPKLVRIIGAVSAYFSLSSVLLPFFSIVLRNNVLESLGINGDDWSLFSYLLYFQYSEYNLPKAFSELLPIHTLLWLKYFHEVSIYKYFIFYLKEQSNISFFANIPWIFISIAKKLIEYMSSLNIFLKLVSLRLCCLYISYNLVSLWFQTFLFSIEKC